jgi:hypothetical protein
MSKPAPRFGGRVEQVSVRWVRFQPMMPKPRCGFVRPWRDKLTMMSLHPPGVRVLPYCFSSRCVSTKRHRSRVVGCHTRLQGEENISVVHDRLVVAPEGANLDFEILFVDDGSNDETGQKLSELEASDDRVRIVALARNFGHQVHCRSRFRAWPGRRSHGRGSAGSVGNTP